MQIRLHIVSGRASWGDWTVIRDVELSNYIPLVFFGIKYIQRHPFLCFASLRSMYLCDCTLFLEREGRTSTAYCKEIHVLAWARIQVEFCVRIQPSLPSMPIANSA